MTPETWAALSAFVGTVGFPAFVAVFVLWRLERALLRLVLIMADVAAVLRVARDEGDLQSRMRRPPRED